MLLLSAIRHDLDHPGVNNTFVVETGHDLAVLYNDASPLENHHCSTAFRMVKECHLFGYVDAAKRRQLRRGIIACIMATDISIHNDVLNKFAAVLRSEGGFAWDSVDHMHLLLSMMMKASDLSNELRPWHVSKRWADQLLDEFFAQGRREIEEKIPLTPFMQPENVNQDLMQTNFIGQVILPLYRGLNEFFPEVTTFRRRMKAARDVWTNRLEKTGSADERAKVQQEKETSPSPSPADEPAAMM